MKKSSLLLLVTVGLSLIVSNCKKDEEDPPYVGSWESAVFQDPTSGVSSKMTFVFEKSSFLTEVSVMAGPNTFIELLGVQGDIEEKANQTLDVSLTDIGLWDAGLNDYTWQNRTENPTEFEALYQGYMANSMLKDFEAVYEIEGDNLDLIVAAVNDTIHLFRI